MNKSDVHSVYSLINELCEKINEENNPNELFKLADVPTLRAKCYEILLQKTKYSVNFKNYDDPFKELDIIYFEKKIKASTDSSKVRKVEEFEQVLNNISQNAYFSNDCGKNILIFLLYLKDSLKDYTQNEDEVQPSILVPKPFNLHLNYSQNLHSSWNDVKSCTNTIENIKTLRPILDFNNPYIPKHLFTKDKNSFLDSAKIYKMQLEKKNRLNYMNYLTPIKPILNLKSLLDKESNLTICKVNFNDTKIEKVDATKSIVQQRFGWNWENLGSSHIQREKKFITDFNINIPLETLIHNNSNSASEKKMISLTTFIADVKCLVVGIASDSFILQYNHIFSMAENLIVNGIIPTIQKSFVDECIECGICFRRLHTITLKRYFDEEIYNGFVYKALCSAIKDYLLAFRQLVFSYNDTQLVQFHQRIKRFIKQIIYLAYLLRIHPNVNGNIKPHLGPQFLGEVYREITRITEPDLLSLLLFILKRCCDIYFKQLQKWIFLGYLDNSSNELFISYVDNYNENTKYFYDKAYFIRKEFVPGFFQGYEEQILQCGKYTMLLKAFDSNHPLFSIKCPFLTVCLSFGELQNVEEACTKYLEEASRVCEKPITVQDIYNRNIEKQKNFINLVKEKSQRNFKVWNSKKMEILVAEQNKKKKYFNEMLEEKQKNQINRNKERMKNIVLEREVNKKQKISELEYLNLEEERLLKHIKCYEELNSITEKQSLKHLDLDNKSILSVCINSCEEEDYENEFLDIKLQNKLNSEIQNNNISPCNKTNTNQNDTVINLNSNLILNSKLNQSNYEIDNFHSNQNEGNGIKNACVESQSIKFRKNIENNNFTQAQRNKLKVLVNEYNMYDTSYMDFNCNSIVSKSPSNFHLDLNSIKSNKKEEKLLENITIESGHLTVNTPMSTSSDSCLEDEKESYQVIETIINEKDVISSNKILNTSAEKITTNTDELNKSKSELQEINYEEVKYGEINENCYERCLKIIFSNFKCKPITGLIEWNSTKNEKKFSDDNIFEEFVKKQTNLNSLNVITLTEFLQKSLILPLTAHLKIMNNEIMRVFLENLDLIGHFKSLRNYFFLIDGEFGSIICEELIGKLENGATPSELFKFQMLHSILDKAIGSSNCASDKNSENLSFIASDIPEKFDSSSPSVFLNLCLSYRVVWPLNLILNPETLEKYGDIFKYLLKLRRISWVLEQSFRILNESAKLCGEKLVVSPQYKRIQLIRHKFFHFVNALRNHITASALQATWKEFEDDLLKAQCIEAIYRKHANYIKKILFLCMLNKSSSDFNKTIELIFKVALRFYKNLKSREWKKRINENYYTHSRYEKLLIDENEFEKLVKYVIYLGNKIVKRGYQEEIGQLINLINYNDYYDISL